ncbi:sulfate transporter/antisigma-factor antagonist STAS [Nitrobacter sp. Nb-311A]|uniref:SulP family inorganic anion transporter n=1 Tax=unclassified Nitrobacter TaxID=2620411 RepID=UPI0000687152|nr:MULTISPECIES: SulP family inorganic anion transporter [unclassified Nitrobacter]EAQ34339.1 sulfate transporter/antisigma-factor antagonist STAS [Nitrobacter sp. Nb-311A]MCB1393662.1 STAS domain-containing protein [Nitrobacter sp.]MCV0387800.1 STAS domain-containing protein [Nitrobacter sp.]
MAARSVEPTFVEAFTPKLVTVLREGYRVRDFRADVLAGLTVAIVAIPLSMAIAIASGVTPDRGLYTAIIGGFIVSLLGGSRFQIGGPAGAFIVLVATTVGLHGVEGLLLATLIAGVIQLTVGLLRLGTFIKYIPFPVTIGFTAGISVIIFASQLTELLGLTLAGKEPGELIPKLMAIGEALPTINAAAVAVSIPTIGLIVAIRYFRPHWPAMLMSVGVAAVAAWLIGLPVETIGTRFGGIPQTLPAPILPVISLEKIQEVLPAALSFALLGSIESLLSAVVADSMSGQRHRSNCELVAQGIANIASPLFGGFCVTGTIARTATNVRSGAHGPVAGMLHAVFLLLFMLVAAPLASYIPLAALGAVLAVVAWNMAERHAFAMLIRASRSDAVVLLTTFLVVIFRGLMEGILVGFGIGALLFLHRMAQMVEVKNARPLIDEDEGDGVNGNGREAQDVDLATHPDVAVHRISGAFFFGAAANVGTALDGIGDHQKAYVIDFSAVPVIDSSGAATIEGFVHKTHRRGAPVYIAGASPAIRRTLLVHGVKPPYVRFRSDLAEAVKAAHNRVAHNRAAHGKMEQSGIARRDAAAEEEEEEALT